MFLSKHSFECFPLLWVEDSVDEGVETGINIAKEGCDTVDRLPGEVLWSYLILRASRMLRVKQGVQYIRKLAESNHYKGILI